MVTQRSVVCVSGAFLFLPAGAGRDLLCCSVRSRLRRAPRRRDKRTLHDTQHVGFLFYYPSLVFYFFNLGVLLGPGPDSSDPSQRAVQFSFISADVRAWFVADFHVYCVLVHAHMSHAHTHTQTHTHTHTRTRTHVKALSFVSFLAPRFFSKPVCFF